MTTLIKSGEPMDGTAAGEVIIGAPASGADNTINGNGGDDLILGDSDTVWSNTLGAVNTTMAAAMVIDAASLWSASTNNPIINGPGAHTTVYVEPGAGEARWFAVTVGAGETLTVDVDFHHQTAWGGGEDTSLTIYNSAGVLVAGSGDDGTDFGSVGTWDPRLGFTVPAAGTYYIRLEEYGDGTFEGGEHVLLHVSVTGHAATAAPLVGGDDTIDGGDGHDTIYGMLGTDTVHGGSGNDIVVSTGEGSYFGDAGNDVIYAREGGEELLDGGDGVDRLNLTGATGNYVVNLANGATNHAGESFVNFENVTAGSGSDTIHGTADVNAMLGGDGNDTLSGLGSGDVLDGGNGNDTLLGGDGNDNLNGGIGDDTISGGAGDDLISDAGGVNAFDGGDGDDYLSFYFSVVNNASARGGAGIDTLNFAFFEPGANVVVNLDGTTVQGADTMITEAFEKFSFNGTNHVTVYGTAGDNTITTGDGSDVLHGLDGNDILGGGGGADTMFGGLGDDTLYLQLIDGEAAYGEDGTDSLVVSGSGIDAIGVNLFTGTVIQGAAEMTALGFEAFSFTGAHDLTVFGTSGDNVIIGGAGNDTIYGDSGGGGGGTSGDHLHGGEGSDLLYGEAGIDRLYGGGGNDVLRVGEGGPGQVADGGEGNDAAYFDHSSDGWTIDLAAGTASLGGAPQAELVSIENATGGSGNDTIRGTAGDNNLMAGGGNDVVHGGGGHDSLYGGGGDDALHVAAIAGYVDGGGETDTLHLDALGAGAVTIDFASGGVIHDGAGSMTIFAIENLEAASLSNDLAVTGRGGTSHVITTGSGDDRVSGGGIDINGDTISTGAGDDTIFDVGAFSVVDGGAGTDTFDFSTLTESTAAVYVNLVTGIYEGGFGGARFLSFAGIENYIGVDGATDEVRGTGAANAIDGMGGDDFLSGRAGADVLDGGLGADRLNGGLGNDTLAGEAGNDVLQGGAGDDAMAGGADDDIYYVDSAGDAVTEAANAGIDRVRASVDHVLAGNVEELTLLAGARAGTGNGLANTMFGSGGGDTLSGLAGNDTLRGNDGRDTLLGGTGNDLLDGGAGKDAMTGGDGRDSFQFRDGDMGATRSLADVIADFSQADADLLRLNLVDASTVSAGDQAFAWIGSGAFTAAAGQLRYAFQGGATYVEGDTDGDGTADFAIALTGTINLTASDFVL